MNENFNRSSRPNDGSESNSVPASLQKVTDAARKRFASTPSDERSSGDGPQSPSRRRMLAGTAAAGVAAVGMSGSAGAGTAAQDDSENEDDGPSEIDVLNYALTLEHLENAFYRDGIDQFSDQEFRTAEGTCSRNEKLNQQIPQRLEAVGEHEAAHVDTLVQTIEDLGGDPVEEACYDFGYESAGDYLAIARVLENTGVSAYDGAIHFLETGELLTAGATIATVEARHASYLNTVLQENPFPRAFDQAKAMEEIKEAISQFIVECEDE